MRAPDDWMPKGKAGSARSAALMAAWPPGERGRPPGPRWLKEESGYVKMSRKQQQMMRARGREGGQLYGQYDQFQWGGGGTDDNSDGGEWGQETYSGQPEGSPFGAKSDKV